MSKKPPYVLDVETVRIEALIMGRPVAPELVAPLLRRIRYLEEEAEALIRENKNLRNELHALTDFEDAQEEIKQLKAIVKELEKERTPT